MNLILISFLGEGATDYRFFSNIVQRLVGNLLLEQGKEGVIQWQPIHKKGNSAQEIVYNASLQSRFSTTLILHSDSDNNTIAQTITNKFQLGINQIQGCNDDEVCKNITLAIPVTETEAWMLVDKDLLKSEMNTNLSNQALGLTYQLNRIERIADPKQTLNDAINVHHQSLPRKRRKYAVAIDDLYETLSQNIELAKLESLASYKQFKDDLIIALQRKNIID
jgi:Domain of unknown function (DUF4276)